MSLRELNRFKNFIRQFADQSLVLAQVESTQGSTYRKKGAIKIVADNGESVGLISGGCLEKEIVEKALSLVSPQEVHMFDASDSQDRLFGYELGCVGRIRMEFSRKTSDEILALIDQQLSENQIHIRVVGAGADLDPLYELIQWMGWNVQLFTEKRDILEQRSQQKWPIHLFSKEDLLDSIDTPARTAVLLMSHNYSVDLESLAVLAGRDLEFVGVLGPAARRQQMIEDLHKIHGVDWPIHNMDKLIGPVGTPGIGVGEDAIALSIVSQLQSRFFAGLES